MPTRRGLPDPDAVLTKEMGMLKSISGAIFTVVVLAVGASGSAKATDTTTFPTVRVTATTSDKFVVYLPADFIPSAKLRPSYSSIGETDFETDLSRMQVCQVLRQHPPQNCTTSNYPASPGIPSASGAEWAGNGCGSGPMSTAFASMGLEILHPGLYSGDLNKPVKGNPSIDFTSSCNKHDELYTSGVSKSFADSVLRTRLSNVCSHALGDGDTCLAFRDTYVSTVQSHGGSAYAADQQQLACSAWGDSMKKSGCA
jgi:hypothetical protein